MTRWILTAGTGRSEGLPMQIATLAEELGRLLAEHGYGLVIGGWPGVDYLVAKGFAEVTASKSLALADYMIQVVSDERPMIYPSGIRYPDFRGGHNIVVPAGVREWIEALKYADAVILIGGEGGTLETYYYALQEQRPVFPILKSGGDAERAFIDIENRWEILPYKGYSKNTFCNTLSMSISDLKGIRTIIDKSLQLVYQQFNQDLIGNEEQDYIFVSYAREDRNWLIQLRSTLRPFERKAKVSIWDDREIAPGEDFEKKISGLIDKAKLAILIVSDYFVTSDFITNVELPLILKRQQENKLKLLWLLIEGELYKNSEVHKFQAVINPSQPLASMAPAVQQDILIQLRKELSSVF
jgi:hypothetical protein